MMARLPFAALLAANALSLIGSVMTFIAIPWFVLETTGSATKTGLAGAVTAGTFTIAGILGGTLVDRLGFKRASVLADVLSAACIAAIPLLDAAIDLQFWQLLILLALAVLTDMPGVTARESLLPDVAGQAEIALERANGVFHAIPRFAQLVGPVVAGLLIAAIGAENVLWIDACTFVGSAMIVVLAVPIARHEREGDKSESPGRYVTNLREGLSFLHQDRLLFAMTMTSALGNMIGTSLAAVILPVYVRETSGNPLAFGILISAYGIGALAGALVFGAFGARLDRRRVFVASWLANGASIAVVALQPGLTVSTAAMLVWGISSGPLLPLTFTIAQERTPERLRGRVFGARAALANGASPLGVLIAGPLLDLVSVGATLLLFSALSLPVIAYVMVSNTFRQMSLPSQPSEGKEQTPFP